MCQTAFDMCAAHVNPHAPSVLVSIIFFVNYMFVHVFFWMYGLEWWGVEAMEPTADGIAGFNLFRDLYLWRNGTEAIPGLASF